MDKTNGYTNNKTPNIYFKMHKQIVEAPEFAKRAKFLGKWRSKI